MQDLQEVTQDVHYENFRSERLAKNPAQRKPTVYVCCHYEGYLLRISQLSLCLCTLELWKTNFQKKIESFKKRMQRSVIKENRNKFN